MDTPRVWFPAIRAGSGADVFTQRLADGLNRQGVRAEITWLPHHAEYAPWTVPIPKPPRWANVVHVNTWLHRRFIPDALPVVATIHHVVHDPAFAPYRTRAQALYHATWIKRVETAVLKRADTVIADSDYTASQVRAIFGREDIPVIPIGIDTQVFRPGPSRPPRQPFRLLFVGNWSLRKGADLLPEIMKRLGPNFELWTTAGLRGRRGRRHLPANIRFLGRVGSADDLVRVYQDADALLFPSRLEGFGLVALEAQACGLPVIATNGSAIVEVVAHESTGLLCAMNDVDSFVVAVKRLANDANMRSSMGGAGRARTIRCFSEAAQVHKYKDLYGSLNSLPRLRTFAKSPLR